MFAGENGLQGDPRLKGISDAIRVIPHFPKREQEISSSVSDCGGIGGQFMEAGEVISEAYVLEYGNDCLEMHTGAVERGERALIIDDLVATGGTLSAAIRLLERVGAEVIECACVVGLPEVKFHDSAVKISVFAAAYVLVAVTDRSSSSGNCNSLDRLVQVQVQVITRIISCGVCHGMEVKCHYSHSPRVLLSPLYCFTWLSRKVNLLAQSPQRFDISSEKPYGSWLRAANRRAPPTAGRRWLVLEQGIHPETNLPVGVQAMGGGTVPSTTYTQTDIHGTGATANEHVSSVCTALPTESGSGTDISMQQENVEGLVVCD
nr:adenine phosphoribosyltransferase 5-like isoform X2 [Ipomoea batatas]